VDSVVVPAVEAVEAAGLAEPLLPSLAQAATNAAIPTPPAHWRARRRVIGCSSSVMDGSLAEKPKSRVRPP
jgi:hypothetical protein